MSLHDAPQNTTPGTIEHTAAEIKRALYRASKLVRSEFAHINMLVAAGDKSAIVTEFAADAQKVVDCLEALGTCVNSDNCKHQSDRTVVKPIVQNDLP